MTTAFHVAAPSRWHTWAFGAAVASLAALAWGWSLQIAAAGHHGLPLWGRVLMWITMMVGMMIPPEVPTLARLARKGLLSRRKIEGAYLYTPAVSRDQLAHTVAESVIDGLLEGFGAAAVSRLLDRVQREDPERIEALARLIEARRRRR